MLSAGGDPCTLHSDFCMLHTFRQRMQRLIQGGRATPTADAPLVESEPLLGPHTAGTFQFEEVGMPATSSTLRRFPTLVNCDAFFRWLDDVLDNAEGCGFFCAPAPPGD